MSKKTVVGYLMSGVFFSFLFASSVDAFWPFDVLFKKNTGEVKATTSDLSYTNTSPNTDSKAYATYKTLIGMNDACRQMLSQSFPTPVALKTTTNNGKMTKAQVEADYEKRYAISQTSEAELGSIYNNLKSRCDNISALVTRMQKIYRGEVKPSVKTMTVSVTPSKREYDDMKEEKKMDEESTPADLRPTPTKRSLFNFRIR